MGWGSGVQVILSYTGRLKPTWATRNAVKKGRKEEGREGRREGMDRKKERREIKIRSLP